MPVRPCIATHSLKLERKSCWAPDGKGRFGSGPRRGNGLEGFVSPPARQIQSPPPHPRTPGGATLPLGAPYFKNRCYLQREKRNVRGVGRGNPL